MRSPPAPRWAQRRGRLIRQVLTESLVLAVAGSLLGLLVASGSTQLLLSFVSEDTARDLLSGGTVDLDWRVLLATIGRHAWRRALLRPRAGAGPVARGSRHGAHLSHDRGSRQPQRSGGRSTIAEVALAVVLLVGAGLLIRSFMNLTSVELGFAPDGIVVGRMSLQGTSCRERRRPPAAARSGTGAHPRTARCHLGRRVEQRAD